MKIILNNTAEEFLQETLTINELLNLKKYSFRMLVVRINGALVKKEEYKTAAVRDGDDVMILHLVSGG
jgi:thiamine biosynthesis protein ThiS